MLRQQKIDQPLRRLFLARCRPPRLRLSLRFGALSRWVYWIREIFRLECSGVELDQFGLARHPAVAKLLLGRQIGGAGKSQNSIEHFAFPRPMPRSFINCAARPSMSAITFWVSSSNTKLSDCGSPFGLLLALAMTGSGSSIGFANLKITFKPLPLSMIAVGCLSNFAIAFEVTLLLRPAASRHALGRDRSGRTRSWRCRSSRPSCPCG